MKYRICIDGQYFLFHTLDEAMKLLNRAVDVAADHAIELPKVPKISTPDRELKAAVIQARHEIRTIYASAARDAEISLLLHIQSRMEDEEPLWLM